MMIALTRAIIAIDVAVRIGALLVADPCVVGAVVVSGVVGDALI